MRLLLYNGLRCLVWQVLGSGGWVWYNQATMSKIYTKTGDKGRTGLVDGSRVSKASLRIQALGSLDEINAWIGLMLAHFPYDIPEQALLRGMQSWLFVCGSRLAETSEESMLNLVLPDDAVIASYEASIDAMTEKMPPLTNFILPGGTDVAARLHVVRTVVRRAERSLVALQEAGQYVDPVVLRYINRLSDWFFTLARYCNFRAGCDEVVWESH